MSQFNINARIRKIKNGYLCEGLPDKTGRIQEEFVETLEEATHYKNELIAYLDEKFDEAFKEE